MHRTALLLAATLVLGGCTAKPRLHADRGWVRLAAVPGAPAAAYFTVHGGDRDAVLTGVSSDVALRAEMHETMAMGGAMPGGAAMTTMRPLTRVPVPAGGELRFAPGGRHVMLFDVNAGVKPGDTMALTLRYRDVGDERVDARVVAPGDPARF